MTETSTAAALIDAAEGLFATDGIDRASLRAVMRQADADSGSIHYHFGGRERLAAAVLDRTLVPLNDRRLELLEELEAAAGPYPTARELIEALVRPDVEMAHELSIRGEGRARLIGAIYLEPADFVTQQVRNRFAPVAQRFMPHLMRAAPEIPPEVIAWRVRWCLFGTLGAIMADPHEPFARTTDELVQRLVDTTAPAITAPPDNPETVR